VSKFRKSANIILQKQESEEKIKQGINNAEIYADLKTAEKI
jgi:hypothetical protein